VGLKRIALALFLCTAPAWARSATEIPAPVIEVMAKQGLPTAAISIAILDVGSGRLVLSHNPDTPRSPASTIKILTTFAALDMLGPTYTWHTLASIREPPEGGVLGGDLYLQGGGDPYMTLERWWSFAQALRARGLKSIRGDIVIDNSAFSLPLEDPGEFDGKPNRTYNVVPDALMVNFQSIEFHVVPQAGERRVDVIAYPAPANLTIENNVRFTEGRCSGRAGRVDFKVASETWDRVIFSGTLSPRCTERDFTRVLLQPTTYAFGTFVELWHEFGGEFSGKLRVEPAPADNQVLLSFDSLSLGEIVRLTNKFSSNLMARDLLLTLGGELAGKPATPEKGADALEKWSHARGLDLADVDIDNGSGLSRRTRISALQMANILSAAYHSRYAPEFLASLPLAGMDGTLKSRMKTAPAGAVRLKTGHIDGVSAVAGFVTTGAGKSYALVSFVNHPRADFGAAEPVHAALVAWILENL
jgi:D-alanyl-D-alanine carboxypeptidase/D-alanyl-D-alanine-endopeptidase (penicillin-binding protein 4)